ncbi:hypothetical protein NE865_13029 [Phthorimaea operculella]|nr:hypothetical protein NE865_13029 [Phthorimaea operculella]
MPSDGHRRRAGPPAATVTGALALLLVICLVECATEQRLSRGSKPNHVGKVNGWRSQRGGSCLSYGHSCWGAHGKRSAKPPAAAPDWFLDKLFQRLLTNTNTEMEEVQPGSKRDDNRAIYQENGALEAPSADRLGSDNEDFSLEMAANRRPEAKPMLDEELLAKMKLWKIMRDASLE